jgi:LPS sulfotransferase NodH
MNNITGKPVPGNFWPPAHKPFPLNYEPQVHEQEIQRYFSQFHLDKPDYASRLGDPLDARALLMCFLNRSGSNLLAEALHATGQMGFATEYLHYEEVRERSERNRLTSLNDYVRSIIDTHRAAQTSMSIRLSWDQLYYITKEDIIPGIIRNPVFVYVTRKDLAAQALSYQIAKTTGRWKSYIQKDVLPSQKNTVITDAMIHQSMNWIKNCQTRFEDYFRVMQIEPVRIFYEDLDTDLETQVRRVMDAMKLTLDDGWRLDRTSIRVEKQRNEASEERLADFRRSLPED